MHDAIDTLEPPLANGMRWGLGMRLFEDREALRALVRGGDLRTVLGLLRFESWEMRGGVVRGFRAGSTCSPATWARVCTAWPAARAIAASDDRLIGTAPGAFGGDTRRPDLPGAGVGAHGLPRT